MTTRLGLALLLLLASPALALEPEVITDAWASRAPKRLVKDTLG